jgi:anti-sigma regulatory factor (Ser/Thr protein kinase)
MDVFQKLHLTYNESFKRHSSHGKLLEVSSLESEDKCEVIARTIGDIFLERCDLIKKQKDAIETAVAEVTQNIFHHAESLIDGMIAAQYYPLDKFLRIAILDSGIGIPASFGKMYQNTKFLNKPEEALLESIRYKTTSRPANNSGYGLYVTTEILRRSNGGFSIYCGENKMIGSNGKIWFEKVPSWHGTIVNLGFHTDLPFNVTEIYNEMSAQDEITETVIDLPMLWKLK